MQIMGWTLAFAANFYLLFVYAPGLGIAAIVRRAIAAIMLAVLLVVAIALLLRALGATPSQAFGDTLFQGLFSIVVLAMTNFANAAVRGMVETIATFHETHNAANLERFPIRLICQRTGLQRFSGVVWWLGSGLMLYGVWSDMHV